MEGTDRDTETVPVRFERGPGGRGVRVVDAVEHEALVVETDRTVDPRPVDAADAPGFVQAAVAVEAGELRLDGMGAYVRDEAGNVVGVLTAGEALSVDSGDYVLEIDGPMKLYVGIEGPADIAATSRRLTVSLDRRCRVVVGGRSWVKRPAGTITTTADPADLHAAVSHLGSALLTTTSERAWPTLRGYPPRFELGDRLAVPDHIDPPATGVTLAVPETAAAAFTVAPLVFYLGATVTTGEGQLMTDDGFVHDLSSPDLGTGVERALKQCFLLDCVVRTEGYYPADLAERTALEDRLPFDLAGTYEASIAERTERYLSVPFETVEQQVPDWSHVAHVRPEQEQVPLLPHLVNDLAVVRPTAGGPPAVDPSTTFLDDGVAFRRSWCGPESVGGYDRPLVEGYEHRLGRQPDEDRPHIVAVSADPLDDSEATAVVESYRHRGFEGQVTLVEAPTVERLRGLLADDLELLHYVGHVTEDGLVCADGTLDARRLDDVGVDVLVLNACRTLEQGEALVRAGAIGALVTREQVANAPAVRIGRTVARLLDLGFPLSLAAQLAGRVADGFEADYTVVGDGNAVVRRSSNRGSDVIEVDGVEGNDLRWRAHRCSVGESAGTSVSAVGQERWVVIGNSPWCLSNREAFVDNFDGDDDVVCLAGGKLVYSADYEVGDLYDRLSSLAGAGDTGAGPR